jgi:hypothetical protein
MIKIPYLSFRKSVEFVMLIVFFITNIVPSYAMENEKNIDLIDDSPSQRYRKSVENGDVFGGVQTALVSPPQNKPLHEREDGRVLK